MTSHPFWHHPALPIGVFLLVLGLGNWWVSRGKIAEYTQRIEASRSLDGSDLYGFKHLDFRTNAALLRRLHRTPATLGIAEAKRDFYALINNGGRLIALLGLALTAIGAIRLRGARAAQRHA